MVGNDGNMLLAELRKSFRLEPVHLTTVIDVTAEAHATIEMAGEGKPRGFSASARVPFRGSRQFLRTSIAPDFKPRFRGRITRIAVHLITVLPSLDLSAFRDEAVAEVLRTNEALNAFRPKALAYDNRVATEIERIVRTF